MRRALALVLAGVCGAALVGCQSKSQHAHAKGEECCEQDALTDGMQRQDAPRVAAAPQKPVAHFGPAHTIAAEKTIPVATLLASPEQYKGQQVRFTGKVSQVCVKKGCWLRVAPDGGAADAKAQASGGDVFIKFKDPPAGRLIPLEAVGHDVTVEGTVRVGQMSEKAARHFKQDAGAPAEEIEKIVGPQPQVAIAEAGVAIEGVEKARP